MPVRRGVAGLVVAAALLLSVPAAGLAASRHSVDPATVSPTLNPDFAPYTCWDTGGGPICKGVDRPSYTNEVMDWFTCDGQTIYVTGEGKASITRWHLPDGRATKTIITIAYPGDVFSLSPTGDGPTVTIRSHMTEHYEYLEPGVRGSRVMRLTGAAFVVTSPGVGLVAHETGWIQYAPGSEYEEVTDYRGPKDLMDNFDGFAAEVCEILTGG